VENVTLVATGYQWIGNGVRAFDSKIIELIAGSKKNLLLTAYSLTNFKVIEKIEECLERGVSVEVYINQDENNTKALEKLEQIRINYPYLHIKVIASGTLHAKIIVSDQTRVLIGSANLTHSGMLKNYELGVEITDNEISQQVIKILRGI